MRKALERLYGALLYAYPPALRRAHGSAMRQCARTALARQGSGAAPRLFLDLLISVPREWRLSASLSSRFNPKGQTMTGLANDVSYALRLLRRSPGYTLAAVVTLALGIGANTAIFSLADATLLRPLRVARPAELVAFKWSASLPDYREWAARTDVFTGVAAASGTRATIVLDRGPEVIDTAFVSANYFGLLGAQAARGRLLGAADDNAGEIAAVLDHAWWKERLTGDPQAVGRTLRINGETITIAGIAEPGFRGTSLQNTPKVYLPLSAIPRLRGGAFGRAAALENRGFTWLNAIGRLAPGVRVSVAAEAMNAMYARQHAADADARRDGLELESLTERALGGAEAPGVRTFVTLLGGVVALTLLIGCANLANLQLARAAARRREIGVRLALGAGRVRIGRQLLVESLVLAGSGGGLGLAVAVVMLRLMTSFQLPGGIDIDGLALSVNRAALAFALIVSTGTALLFGLVPAWQGARTGPLASLRGESRSTSARSRLRMTLVAAQVALSLVLLAGTGLFLRSFVAALRVPLGFSPGGVATANVTLGAAKGFTTARAHAFFDQALSRVHQLPDVTAAAWTTVLPINGSMSGEVTIDGYTPGAGEDTHFYMAEVGPEYFRAAGTRMLRGRPFAETDTLKAPLVGIVNETAARRFWAGRDPLQGRVKADADHFIQIVAVVEDTKIRALDDPAAPFLYLPFAQSTGPFGLTRASLLVRTSGEVDALLPRLRDQLRAADPDAPVASLTSFTWQVRKLAMPQRMGTALFAIFSLLAVTLASIGIYGVTAYVAALRQRELGIRIALGADRARIRALVLRQGAIPIAAGLLAGILIAALASRLATAFLRGVPPRDPLTYTAVAALLAGIALLATWIPARRASRLDPIRALREE
jgi:putative ABC transport system permease protein